MSWYSGTYGLQGDFGDERPPLWPRLAAVVVLLAVVGFGVRACRSVDRETVRQRQQMLLSNEPDGAAVTPVVKPQRAAVIPQPVSLSGTVPDTLRARVQRADKQTAAGNLTAAFEAYQTLLDSDSNQVIRVEMEARIGALAFPLAVSRLPMRKKTSYTIQRGDSISLIARRFGVTQEYLLRANGLINPDRIVSGRDLYVLDHPVFAVFVSKQARTLTVTLNGRFLKRYPVSIGLAGATPAGTFVIHTRIANPAWWRSDGSKIPYGHPENILGTRWLGLAAAEGTAAIRGYGIHGTWEQGSIGRDASAGCVRMRNADVEELHVLIPLGTSVVIQ